MCSAAEAQSSGAISIVSDQYEPSLATRVFTIRNDGAGSVKFWVNIYQHLQNFAPDSEFWLCRDSSEATWVGNCGEKNEHVFAEFLNPGETTQIFVQDRSCDISPPIAHCIPNRDAVLSFPVIATYAPTVSEGLAATPNPFPRATLAPLPVASANPQIASSIAKINSQIARDNTINSVTDAVLPAVLPSIMGFLFPVKGDPGNAGSALDETRGEFFPREQQKLTTALSGADPCGLARSAADDYNAEVSGEVSAYGAAANDMFQSDRHADHLAVLFMLRGLALGACPPASLPYPSEAVQSANSGAAFNQTGGTDALDAFIRADFWATKSEQSPLRQSVDEAATRTLQEIATDRHQDEGQLQAIAYLSDACLDGDAVLNLPLAPQIRCPVDVLGNFVGPRPQVLVPSMPAVEQVAGTTRRFRNTDAAIGLKLWVRDPCSLGWSATDSRGLPLVGVMPMATLSMSLEHLAAWRADDTQGLGTTNGSQLLFVDLSVDPQNTGGVAFAFDLSVPSESEQAREFIGALANAKDACGQARAVEWLKRLATGNIDNTQLTPAFGALIAAHRASDRSFFQRLGPLNAIEAVSTTGDGRGGRLSEFLVTYAGGTYRYTFGVEASGQIYELLVSR